MLGLVKYIDKLYEIKWYFENEDCLRDYEGLLYCKFKKTDDYYKIEQVLYTYVDILLGMEDLDFDFHKKGKEYILVINET